MCWQALDVCRPHITCLHFAKLPVPALQVTPQYFRGCREVNGTNCRDTKYTWKQCNRCLQVVVAAPSTQATMLTPPRLGATYAPDGQPLSVLGVACDTLAYEGEPMTGSLGSGNKNKNFINYHPAYRPTTHYYH